MGSEMCIRDRTCIVIHEWKGFDVSYHFFGGFHVFYVYNRVQNFANIMYRLCAIQLGECPKALIRGMLCKIGELFN